MIKKFFSKNPILFILVMLFTLFNIIDSITALFILRGESNPIYLYFGSLWPIIILKVLFIILAWWLYNYNKYPTNGQYYFILSVFVLANFLLIIGFASNIYGMLNPQVIDEAAKTSVVERQTYFVQLTIVFYLLPLAFNMITYKLFERSIKKIIIQQQKTVYQTIKGWFVK